MFRKIGREEMTATNEAAIIVSGKMI